MSVQNEVDICNLALDHLNVSPITTITNPTDKVGKVLDRWYDNTRRATLRFHTWNFAMKRASIAKLVTTPEFGYAYEYQLPADYLRIVEVGDGNIYTDYGIETGKLLIDETSSDGLDIRYVFDNTNVDKYDPLFVELIALELAHNICFALTGNVVLKRELRMARDEKRREALGVDGQERKPRRKERSRFKEARIKYGNYGSPYIED